MDSLRGFAVYRLGQRAFMTQEYLDLTVLEYCNEKCSLKMETQELNHKYLQTDRHNNT